MQGLPLAGIRIVSFEQFAAAPYGTMFLGDLGAEILKAEPAEGDFGRRTGPRTLGEDDSLYFQCFNLNKKSVIIDLRNPEDRLFLEGLVRSSHAVINNLRGNLPAKYGLDYASLGRINRAVVCGHISAYGRQNSRAGWPGYDFLMQAEAGLMALTGEPGSPPTRLGVSIIDYMAGMMLAVGVVSAIHSALTSGIGMDVDISLFDAAIHQLAYQGTWYLNESTIAGRAARSAHPSTTPVQLFKTSDGWIYVACMNERFWSLLVEILGRKDLAYDPRFSSIDSRLAHRDILTKMLDVTFTTRKTEEWVTLLSGKVPIAPVHELDEALQQPFLLNEADMVRQIPHPRRPRLSVLANPIRINGERLPQRAAPSIGEHTEMLRQGGTPNDR